jgi:hypothetical protein
MQGLDAHFATLLNQHQAAIDAEDEAEDGHKCQNSEAGNYGHECGSPAEFIGEDVDGYRATFCTHCRTYGREARIFSNWQKI